MWLFMLISINSHKFPKFLWKITNVEYFQDPLTKVSMESLQKLFGNLLEIFCSLATLAARICY